MKVDYWELNAVCNEENSEIITAILSETDFESFIYEDGQLKAYVQETYFKNNSDIEVFLNEIFENLPFQFQFTINKIEPQNWNETWEKQFDPIIIEKKCIVRAPFHEEVSGMMNIIIEPKMSFGTGHHQTTFMMLNQLYSLPLNGKDVLDMGCGTAVLAILSEKLGAKKIVGIDIENWAFENSLENLSLNDCSKSQIRFGGAEQIGIDKFDIILANINKNILKGDLGVYVEALNDNGFLLLSGFFITDVDEILAKAYEFGLSSREIKQKDEWAMIQFRK